MRFVKIIDKINVLAESLLAIILSIMAIVVMLQVLVRFIFEQFSVPWSEEIAKYLMIWLTFIGSAIAARRAKLIAIESVIIALPEKAGKALKFFAHFVSLVFYAILFVIGIDWFQFGFTETAPVMKISKSYVYASMMVGAALMMVNTLAYLIETIHNKEDIRGAVNDDDVDLI
ncbi:TRAP transporter small permease [Psychrobacillus sp. OK032]|uniref:TRAP transporter small permease n=1 Tax=Psychrobacillus sp. OK032 TaxID=1884358 RepID=UPI0008D51567|nr:TRAP transporter small permease [Psychrobacillus sp. OK032]SES19161.1 TRAP-type C4-dicarboxylate transport system, small permease component [Psychrobacillus sp. OK032]